jgi:hypothetical protein
MQIYIEALIRIYNEQSKAAAEAEYKRICKAGKLVMFEAAALASAFQARVKNA